MKKIKAEIYITRYNKKYWDLEEAKHYEIWDSLFQLAFLTPYNNMAVMHDILRDLPKSEVLVKILQKITNEVEETLDQYNNIKKEENATNN